MAKPDVPISIVGPPFSHPEGPQLTPPIGAAAPTSKHDTSAPPVLQQEPSGGQLNSGERETFTNKIDFLLTCMGFSIGLGNVWRFPYLAYKNGGGAFLIPYFLAIIFAGVPLFLLESTLGQYMRLGPIQAWRICPLFQGIGVASTMITLINNCYYNVIMAWCFYYLVMSFRSELPWATCDNDWNTNHCLEDFSRLNGSAANYTDPATEFWENKALKITDGIHDMGSMHWYMLLCFLFAWILVYFIIWKGIRASGKVLYVTTPIPFIVILILLIHGVTLDGAITGIDFFLVPDFSRLSDIDVWSDASSQVFFSYCLAYGCHTAFGSYNNFHHNSFRDVMFFAVANTMTSLLSGMAIFATLGFMAQDQDVSVDAVAESGPGLAFIAYPKAVTEMPVSQLWSILFFVMFIGLGLNSQFLSVEGIVTSIEDFFPRLRVTPYRELSIAAVCTGQFAVGVPMVMEGGMYVFQLFDYYGTGRTGMLVGFLECSVIAYIYGVNHYYDNLEVMYGFRVHPYIRYCWFIFTPLFTLTFFVISTVTYTELTYERPSTTYEYPPWAIAVGWSLAAMSIIWVPIVAVYKIYGCVQEEKSLWTLLDPQPGGPLPAEVPGMLKKARYRSDKTNRKHLIWRYGDGLRRQDDIRSPWPDTTYRPGDSFYTNETMDYNAPEGDL